MPVTSSPRSPAAIAFGAASPSAVADAGVTADAVPAGRHPLRANRSPAATEVVVYVAGEVAHPGLYRLSEAARTADALHAAGGPTGAADLVAVNLAGRIEDGVEIIVPAKGSADAEAALDTVGARVSGTPRRSHRRHSTHRRRAHKRHRLGSPVDQTSQRSAATTPTSTVSLNAADAGELETLPGIGPSLAARIVAFRELNGPFASADELLDVGGMTQAKVDALTPWLDFH